MIIGFGFFDDRIQAGDAADVDDKQGLDRRSFMSVSKLWPPERILHRLMGGKKLHRIVEGARREIFKRTGII